MYTIKFVTEYELLWNSRQKYSVCTMFRITSMEHGAHSNVL